LWAACHGVFQQMRSELAPNQCGATGRAARTGSGPAGPLCCVLGSRTWTCACATTALQRAAATAFSPTPPALSAERSRSPRATTAGLVQRAMASRRRCGISAPAAGAPGAVAGAVVAGAVVPWLTAAGGAAPSTEMAGAPAEAPMRRRQPRRNRQLDKAGVGTVNIAATEQGIRSEGFLAGQVAASGMLTSARGRYSDSAQHVHLLSFRADHAA
jgi:hypothetical protein